MKYLFALTFILIFLGTVTTDVFAVSEYVPLAPLTTSENDINKTGIGLEEYLGNLYTFGIGIAIALAVIMIVYGGIQYMSTDAVSKKSSGKQTVNKAIFGLLLALGSFLIVNTISPQILQTNFLLENVGTSNTPAEVAVVTYAEPENLSLAVSPTIAYHFIRKNEGTEPSWPGNITAQYAGTNYTYLFDKDDAGSQACATPVQTLPNDQKIDITEYHCARYRVFETDIVKGAITGIVFYYEEKPDYHNTYTPPLTITYEENDYKLDAISSPGSCNTAKPNYAKDFNCSRYKNDTLLNSAQ
ncbi:MAG: pilin [Candidatus Paceibacterota bacterium]